MILLVPPLWSPRATSCCHRDAGGSEPGLAHKTNKMMCVCTKHSQFISKFWSAGPLPGGYPLHKELDRSRLFSSSLACTSVSTTPLLFITFSSSPQLEELALWSVIVVGGTRLTQSARVFEWDQDKHTRNWIKGSWNLKIVVVVVAGSRLTHVWCHWVLIVGWLVGCLQFVSSRLNSTGSSCVGETVL